MKKNKLKHKYALQLIKFAAVLVFCFVALLAFQMIGSPERVANSNILGEKPFHSVVGTDNNFFLSPEELSNEKVWSAVASISIPALRFPGGEGNWYNWRTGAIVTDGRATFEFMKKSKPRTVSMDAFMSHARNVGASVSYVLNIMDAPKSTRDLAQHWIQTNAPVRWVEMGNEHYHQNFSEEIGGPSGYLKRARQSLEALRAGGFQGSAGIVLAPLDIPGMPQFEFERQWNEEIAMADIQDFDAIIVHYYPFVKTIGFDNAYQEGPAGLMKTIKILKERFPGKQIWVTEWNLGLPIDIPEFNSLVHAIFNLRMLRAMMDSRVDMSYYHVLTGTGWELLGPDRLALEYNEKSNIKMLRRVPFFAFDALLKAQRNGTYINENLELNGLEFIAFKHDSEIRVVAWTRNEISTRLKLKMPGYKTQFLDGQVLRGQLLDKNGSLLRKGADSPPWVEKIVPTATHTPILKGPGIVFTRFSVQASKI